LATVTLLQLRSRAKSLCDQLTGGFVSDSEWNDYLNAGLDELHGLLVRSGELHEQSSFAFTTAGVEDVALPAAFFLASGVDLQVDSRWREVRPFDWSERNELRNVTTSTGDATRYAIRGGQLKLLPVPPSGLSGTLNYVPVRTPLALDADTYDGRNGWEVYAIVFAAKRALEKGEEDASHLANELARLELRIRTEAATRDGDAPPAVRNIERVQFSPRNILDIDEGW
jgi:hypothetical protein